MLRDRFGRVHTYLRLSLTESCNYRCRYCLPEAEDEDAENPALLPIANQGRRRLSADELFQLASVFVEEGITKIRLTGGEPLLRSDAHRIIARLAELPAELCLSTNASLLHLYFPLLRASGVRSLNISIDSLQPARFAALCGVDDFRQVYQNILTALEQDFRLKLNMVVLNGVNDDEVVDFIAWTRDSSLEVRFIEFMPFPGNHWQPDKLLSTEQLMQRVEQEFGVLEKVADGPHDTTRKYSLPNAKGRFAFISTMSAPFCAGCNRLRVSADGRLRNCLFASGETDLAATLRSGGDLRALIQGCVESKAEMLGGHLAEHWEEARTNAHERPMMSIGG